METTQKVRSIKNTSLANSYNVTEGHNMEKPSMYYMQPCVAKKWYNEGPKYMMRRQIFS